MKPLLLLALFYSFKATLSRSQRNKCWIGKSNQVKYPRLRKYVLPLPCLIYTNDLIRKTATIHKCSASMKPLLLPALFYLFIKQHYGDQRGTSSELANQIKQKTTTTEVSFTVPMPNIYKWLIKKLQQFINVPLQWSPYSYLLCFIHLLSNTK